MIRATTFGEKMNQPKRNPPKQVKGLQHPKGETTTGKHEVSV